MLAVYQKDFLRAALVAVPRAIYLHTPERSMCMYNDASKAPAPCYRTLFVSHE